MYTYPSLPLIPFFLGSPSYLSCAYPASIDQVRFNLPIMTVLTVTYPQQPGAHFNLDHYKSVHIPLVFKHWGPHGLRSFRLIKHALTVDPMPVPAAAPGTTGGGVGEPSWIAILDFASAEDCARARSCEGTKEVMSDLPKFTNMTPGMSVWEDAY